MNETISKFLGLPVVTSAHGRDVDHMIILVHWLMAVLFIGWIIYFIYVLFRFRKGANPKADYQGARSHASTYVEVAVAGVEAVLLIAFAIPLWAKVVDQLPAEDKSTVVRVIAQQFGWNFLYPGKDGKFGKQEMILVTQENPFGFAKDDPQGNDDFTTLNDMTVEVNKPVLAYISSKDVIHSFKLIAMRVTQDAIPGLRIPTHFIPQQVGRYQINCAQLCGNGHAAMAQGFVNVVSAEDYSTWAAAKPTRGAGGGGTFE
ncbi:MAG: cytochrome c oxidase subunit II [Verrucomicrobia bacterium]|nr:cytochrome c oxidase subunit II [Verrucomicrobiota bacterium]